MDITTHTIQICIGILIIHTITAQAYILDIAGGTPALITDHIITADGAIMVMDMDLAMAIIPITVAGAIGMAIITATITDIGMDTMMEPMAITTPAIITIAGMKIHATTGREQE